MLRGLGHASQEMGVRLLKHIQVCPSRKVLRRARGKGCLEAFEAGITGTATGPPLLTSPHAPARRTEHRGPCGTARTLVRRAQGLPRSEKRTEDGDLKAAPPPELTCETLSVVLDSVRSMASSKAMAFRAGRSMPTTKAPTPRMLHMSKTLKDSPPNQRVSSAGKQKECRWSCRAEPALSGCASCLLTRHTQKRRARTKSQPCMR